jgi:hypothetical protein
MAKSKKTQLTGEPKKAKDQHLQSREDRQGPEKVMRRSEKYVRMIDHSPDIVYVLDHEGHFIFLGGATKQETWGHPLKGGSREKTPLLGKKSPFSLGSGIRTSTASFSPLFAPVTSLFLVLAND